MKVKSTNPLRHNFAIWVMGRRPGWFKPQRYMYRCLRCRWCFIVNDEYRGSLRCASDAGELSRSEELRRIGSFIDGPCLGYANGDTVAEEPPSKVIPLRREVRHARTAHQAQGM